MFSEYDDPPNPIKAGSSTPITQGPERLSEEKHGSHEAGATGLDTCSRSRISEKREAGVTHVATQRSSATHIQTDRSCLKIESENLFRESISSTIVFPREDKIYTRPAINQFHKTLETLVREFAKR